MNLQQAELYKRLQEFSLDEKNVSFSFSQRLARENNWTAEYTQRVIDEYKKFAVLAVFAGHPVTPSDQVDQVWHLHLTYTQSYWHNFCGILGTQLHHGPTRGGNKEYHKFNDWYLKTIESYERIFREIPPVDIWPAPHIRFDIHANFQRVDTNKNWVLPKPNLNLSNINISGLIPQRFYLALLFTLTLILTNSQILLASNNSNSQGSQDVATVDTWAFCIIVGCLIVGSIFWLATSQKNKRGSGSRSSRSSSSSSSWGVGTNYGGSDSSGSDSGGGGCGGGGCGGGGCGGGGCGGGGCGGGG